MGHEEMLAAFRRGDNSETARLANAELEAAVASGDSSAHVDAVCMLARVALRDGDLDAVKSLAMQARGVAREAGERRLERIPVHLLAAAARMGGRFDEARTTYLESIALNDELGETRMAALEHRNLAYVEIHVGDHERAKELFAESRRRFVGVDDPALRPYLTFDDAVLASLDGDVEEASDLLTTMDREFRELGAVPDPDDAAEIAGLRLALSHHEDDHTH